MFHASLNKAILSGADLSSAIMNYVDLSEAKLDSATLNKADLSDGNLSKADFSSCKMKQAVLIHADISGSNFTKAVLDGVSLSPTKIDSKTCFIDASMKNAILNDSNLMNIEMSGADLTNAHLERTILNGVNLSFAILNGANMANAQLGDISLLFLVMDKEMTSLKGSLEKKDTINIIDIFGAHQVELEKPVEVDSSLINPDIWTVKDNKKSYYLRSETLGGSSRIGVYVPVISASLSKAVMVDTILTEANLMGIKASGMHLYGMSTGKALLDNAILEKANFSNANLGNINLTSALLNGAILDSAVLTNANLQGAKLKNASLVNANLQAANLKDADLESANLSDAAVSVTFDESGSDKYAGVWIFNTESMDIDVYISELNNGANIFPLNPALEKELVNGNVNEALREAFREDKNVFCWDEIPGKHKERLLGFLAMKFGNDWIKTAKLDKNDNIIKVYTDRNHISLKLNDTRTEVILEIDDGRTDKLIAKTETNKLNIYEKGIILSDKASIEILDQIDYWQVIDDKMEFSLIKGINAGTAAIICLRPSGGDPFSINLGYADYLTDGAVNDKVREAFSECKIALTQEAKVSIRKRNDVWRICDDPVSYDIWEGLTNLEKKPLAIVSWSDPALSI